MLKGSLNMVSNGAVEVTVAATMGRRFLHSLHMSVESLVPMKSGQIHLNLPMPET